jgi:hypothetical protein
MSNNNNKDQTIACKTKPEFENLKQCLSEVMDAFKNNNDKVTISLT